MKTLEMCGPGVSHCPPGTITLSPADQAPPTPTHGTLAHLVLIQAVEPTWSRVKMATRVECLEDQATVVSLCSERGSQDKH